MSNARAIEYFLYSSELESQSAERTAHFWGAIKLIVFSSVRHYLELILPNLMLCQTLTIL